ncbi:MAG: hypothetical protein JWN70_6604 [Planctomycetaceae bacterium]|nr:hypothetical protein [Planctomycetaceae bacterium]
MAPIRKPIPVTAVPLGACFLVPAELKNVYFCSMFTIVMTKRSPINDAHPKQAR